jgi:hypothetical protein
MLLAKEGEFRSQKCVHSITLDGERERENKDRDKEGIGFIHQHINTTYYYQIITINMSGWKAS